MIIMTAKELIAQLETLPPRTKILIPGPECGYNDVQELRPRRVKRDKKIFWVLGEYSDSRAKDAINAIELYAREKK